MKELFLKTKKVATLGIFDPIHFGNILGCRLRSWVLANRTYHILGDLAATNVAQLELKVAWGPSGWWLDGHLSAG